MKSSLRSFVSLFTLALLTSSPSFSQVIVSDDFEGNSIGDFPAGWTLSSAGESIVVTGAPVAEGARALRIKGAQGLEAYINRSLSISNDYSFEFYVLLPDTGFPAEVLGSAKARGAGVSFALGSTPTEGVIYWSTISDGITVPTNQWHHVRIDADYQTNTLQVTVNSAESRKYSISFFSGNLDLRASSTNNSLTSRLFYIDSIVVASSTVVLTPAPVVLSSPSNGSTNQSSPVYTYWNSISGATGYHLQISADSAFATGLVVDDTSLTSTNRANPIPPLQVATTYFWRVRAKNANGWGDWSTAWTFRTIEPPSPPNLSSPSNNATLYEQSSLFHSWNFISGYIYYHLQIATDSTFTTVVYNDSLITSTNRSVTFPPLAGNTRYYWRVRVLGAAGWSQYSTVRNYMTTPPPTAYHNQPSNLAVLSAASFTVSYFVSNPEVADTFFVQIAADTGFTSLVIDTSLSVTSFQASLSRFAAGSKYYWRVRAKNSSGLGPWTARREFSIVAPPAAPTNFSPTSGSTVSTLSPFIDWGTVSGAVAYQVQIATDAAFTTIVDDQEVTTSSYSASSPPLQIGVRYYWRVRARNNAAPGPYGPVWSFTMPSVPPPPVVTQPVPGTMDLFGVVTFGWTSAPGKDTTHVQIATDTNAVPSRTIGVGDKRRTQQNFWEFFSTSYYNDIDIDLSVLPFNTPFFVRVRDHNDLGWGNFSHWDQASYTTLRPPSAPVLFHPPDGATNVPFINTLIFTNHGPNAVPIMQQNVSVSTTPGPEGIVHDRRMTWNYSSPDREFYTYIPQLQENSTYYYQIETYNAAGTETSDWYNFTTANPYPVLHCTGDVPFDQGGQCQVEINASGLDSGPCSGEYSSSSCTEYYQFYRLWLPEEIPIWHQRSIKDAVDKLPDKYRVATADIDSNFIWEPVFGFPAIGKPRYLLTVRTRTDSAAGRRYWERYVLLAFTGSGRFYCSNIDSGYSVDNLAPNPPGGSVASFQNGQVRVAWQPNTEPDLRDYAVYRTTARVGSVEGLTPIGTTSATEFIDANPPAIGQLFYYIVARDKNDNQSSPAEASTGVPTGVESLSGVPEVFSLGQNYPNPFNPSTTIRFGLPVESAVTIQVINALGQVVDEVAHGVLPAGFFQVAWHARVPSGLYMYRLTAEGTGDPERRFTAIRKMVLLR